MNRARHFDDARRVADDRRQPVPLLKFFLEQQILITQLAIFATSPQQQKKMIEELQNGNVVLTSGGIVGTIVSIDGDTLVLRVKPDNIKLQVARSAVSNLIPAEGKKQAG